MPEADATFKLCIFGDGGVGKTTLARRFLTGYFNLETKMTMGAEIFVKYLEVEGKRIALQIWDFGGEEQFRFLLPTYASGSSAGIFMYDITRYSSLEKLDEWITNFKKGLINEGEDIPILMVGGKLDLEGNRSAPHEDVIELAKSRNLFGYVECSSLTGQNVEKIFETLTQKMLKNAGLI